ncbi:TetR/AcrR family transcriptional regulator [Nocardia sp. alder85J]|uniref:TetR/AcrR family transcriptional regulator n=1 Tax=Nocardia sp. alder85J TaxID=2862949 RepID=UPI001CD4D630|nr:TetR/AcrR family transcriptional regulator [Nocardia sp. alder85J]MCX4091141.1 helix-turn-helix domain containing protein [Nocardia sp. alder85J]
MPPDRPPAQPRQRAMLGNTRSRETRQALVRAALRLWAGGDFDHAYETSSAADIARAAGVSKGTFYFHFAGKEDILLEMTSATARTMLDRIETGSRADVPLRTLTDQVVTAMADRVVRAPRGAAARAGALGSKARAGEVTLAGPRLGDAFEALARYGARRGELGAAIAPADTAAMLTAVTVDAVIRWGASDHPSEWLHRTLCERARVVLNGVAHTDQH